MNDQLQHNTLFLRATLTLSSLGELKRTKSRKTEIYSGDSLVTTLFLL